jgi:ATP-binding cassette, subfamily B, bacterial PglK
MRYNSFKERSSNLIKLWYFASKRRQYQFWALLALMTLSSLLEVISIGAVIPFLGVLTAPEKFYDNAFVQPIVHFYGISDPDRLIFYITIAFIAIVIIATIVRLILFYAITRYSFAMGADLSIKIYRHTLYQEYSVHISRNSSEVINGIITKTSSIIGGVILPFLNFMSSIILLIGIILLLLSINIAMTLLVFIGFGAIYIAIARFTKSSLQNNSKIIAKHSNQMVKSLQEGLGGIRDVLIDGSQEFYCQKYSKSDLLMRRAAGNNLFISESPRHAMEAIGIILLVGLAYVLIQREGGADSTIPFLGMLALGAQRLLPALQRVYSAYSRIKGTESSLKDIVELLQQKLPQYLSQTNFKSVIFEEEIRLKNVSFCYSDNSPFILRDINLQIAKGEKIGFIGETGCGKSTLLDIIMGLLPPSSGELAIDQVILSNQNYRAWQKNIAHVPQKIYLADSTIDDNIAYGISNKKADYLQIRKSAKNAKISEFIESLNEGYQTMVGENGVSLSGGQLQRIGIARAFYKNTDVLILDEATSALDGKTESEIMRNIDIMDKGLTIIIIAHRLTTLKYCDRIYKLEDGRIVNFGSYEEIIVNQGGKNSQDK